MSNSVETLVVQAAHDKAIRAARDAAQEFADRHFEGNDGGPCGFAWVDAYGIRSNSKMGKALQAVGFRKSYSGGLQQWNGRDGWYFGQSVDASEAGARAYAEVFREELELDRVFAGSRLD